MLSKKPQSDGGQALKVMILNHIKRWIIFTNPTSISQLYCIKTRFPLANVLVPWSTKISHIVKLENFNLVWVILQKNQTF